MEPAQVKQLVRNIEGWLTDDEGALLYELAKRCTGKGVIVEIGSWKGKSTIWLGKGSQQGNRVRIHAIDPHTGSSEHKVALGEVWTFDEFKRNISYGEVDDLVTPIVRTSEEAARDFDRPVELAFIDGAHEYEMVKLDFRLWFPKVIDGGFMAFHDATLTGPKEAVEELVYRSASFRNPRLVGSVVVAQKVSRSSLGDKLRNRWALFVKHLYEFASGLHLPKPVRALGKRFARVAQ